MSSTKLRGRSKKESLRTCDSRNVRLHANNGKRGMTGEPCRDYPFQNRLSITLVTRTSGYLLVFTVPVYWPNNRGNAVVSAGIYVISRTPTDRTTITGRTAHNTSGTGFRKRYEDISRFSPTGGVK